MRLDLHLDLDGAAFWTHDDPPELARRVIGRAIDHATDRLLIGDDEGTMRDLNGNTCGRWTLAEPAPLDPTVLPRLPEPDDQPDHASAFWRMYEADDADAYLRSDSSAWVLAVQTEPGRWLRVHSHDNDPPYVVVESRDPALMALFLTVEYPGWTVLKSALPGLPVGPIPDPDDDDDDDDEPEPEPEPEHD